MKKHWTKSIEFSMFRLSDHLRHAVPGTFYETVDNSITNAIKNDQN
ncbi:hypothetical protein D1BOALGB6SA_9027 [Olavius sp. associated proteobacterium Delta 1]|nr:hypothetical protein D1BOALGB6SA_9027 [Olavius sp. associated proteobacterium Delta 1]